MIMLENVHYIAVLVDVLLPLKFMELMLIMMLKCQFHFILLLNMLNVHVQIVLVLLYVPISHVPWFVVMLLFHKQIIKLEELHLQQWENIYQVVSFLNFLFLLFYRMLLW